eukprot:CAMPEP_0195508100 /NCGR_PEP_ID=MMETSP0794_2-20130614/1399_1 /TAXON_ID=515487 /ORGANISM="Stephanopyxis turris, Strain CCMP 815" /LENGTH=253 /DNA_ID=CAMNT_0040634975 /DNA_START=49 /DNA_END=810 /DNA_ORIENTATION=-
MKNTINTFKASKTTDAALTVLNNGVSTLESLEELLNDKFPFEAHQLSAASKAFEDEISTKGAEEANSTLENAIPPTRDAIALGIAHIQTLEAWITLSIPPVEDGNNFGVSIQLDVAKFLDEKRKEFGKILDSIPAYYGSRADVVDKLNLPSGSTSVTTTKTKSETSGGKDGDEAKTSTTVVEEDKESGPKKQSMQRLRQLVALDVQFYNNLRSSLVSVTDGYATIMDNCEKNYDKLAQPKGSSGGRHNMMSMF